MQSIGYRQGRPGDATRLLASFALALTLAVAPVGAQPVPSQDVLSSAPQPVEPAQPAAQPLAVPAGTPVSIRIERDVSSKTAKRGDRFPIALAFDLVHEGLVALPAGTAGEGEVVHAAPKGFGGRAGELLLAARYLEHQGVRIPLRGLKIGVAGADNATEAVVATMVFLPAGLFVTGTSVEVKQGQMAQAKLAATLPLALGVAATPSTSPAAPPANPDPPAPTGNP